jgi:2-polyprenyl-3-methyl-5-hydroxy-6-metoxy-1,4-benzoquinol methylase
MKGPGTRWQKRAGGESLTTLWDSGERVRAEPHNTLYLEHLSAYEAAGRFARQGTVLDIGCGEGYGVSRMAANAGYVLGVDVEPDVVTVVTRRYRDTRVRFACMDGMRLAVRSASVDLVTSFQVLEHVPDPDALVSEIARVLRPTGVAVLSTPNALIHLGPRNPFHVHEFNPRELQALLEKRFVSVVLAGQRRPPAIYALEAACQGVRRWDVLGLRRFVPRALVSLIVYGIALRKGLTPPQRLPLSSFPISSRTDDAYNLFALCGHRLLPEPGLVPQASP